MKFWLSSLFSRGCRIALSLHSFSKKALTFKTLHFTTCLTLFNKWQIACCSVYLLTLITSHCLLSLTVYFPQIFPSNQNFMLYSVKGKSGSQFWWIESFFRYSIFYIKYSKVWLQFSTWLIELILSLFGWLCYPLDNFLNSMRLIQLRK